MTKELITGSGEETIKTGERLAVGAAAGDIFALTGELGAGKTVLAKGIARGLGIKEEIVSPSYVLIREYAGRIPLYHFDLYRLKALTEMEGLGYEEYFYGQGLTVIEWAERLGPLLPAEHLLIELESVDINRRRIRFSPVGKKYKWITEI